MPRTDKSPGPFVGRWSIVEMEMRDAEAIHLVGPGEIEFRDDGFGSMNFIVVSCDLDTELTTRDGQPAIAWSWYGDDDGHEASGRGWAVIREDGVLAGRVYFHRGDASDFTAVRAEPNPKKK